MRHRPSRETSHTVTGEAIMSAPLAALIGAVLLAGAPTLNASVALTGSTFFLGGIHTSIAWQKLGKKALGVRLIRCRFKRLNRCRSEVSDSEMRTPNSSRKDRSLL